MVLASAACSGGGDSGPISGLHGPEQVSIVESSGGSSSAVRLPHGVRGVAGSDYQTDPTRFWVRDDAMKTLDTVNMILDSLSQTHYADQTNAGSYRCLVENTENNGGGETGNNSTTYEEWIVDSTRASNDDPQLVSFWVKQDELNGQPGEGIIYGLLQVDVEPTDAQPLGKFSLRFKCLAAAALPTSTDTVFQGYLRTVDRTDSQSEVEFYMWHGDPDGAVPSGQMHMRETVHVVGDPATDAGRAYAEYKHSGNNYGGGGTFVDEGEYQMQFNANYVAMRDVVNGNTLDVKDRNDYDTYVYRYGVYDATTEDRVAQLSGFPVEDQGGHHGWAGFYGIWFPENVTVVNDMQVYRRSYQNNTLTPYTVVAVPGKLEKRTRASITFGDIVDEDLDMFDPQLGSDIRARYTGQDFVRVAVRVNGEWQLENTPVSIASSFTTGQWVHCWSQARGDVEFSWPATLDNQATAFVWAHTTINADAPELANGDLTLHGYWHMLAADITQNQANWLNNESPYLPDATTPTSGNQDYVFDKETLMLQLGGHDVNFLSGVTVSQGPAMFGLNCGPLFATALNSFGEMSSVDTTYDWVIGTNAWNQLRTLKDEQGAYVAFTPPLRFEYVHSQSGSPFDGRTFFLEWDGSNLGGIPFDQNVQLQRWYPQFNIPTGTTLTHSSTSYKVKQLEGEQVMVSVPSPSTVYAAQGFDLDTPLSAPTSAPYADPAIGTMPDITTAPRYVGGVLQADS